MNSIVAMSQTLFKCILMNTFQAFCSLFLGCSVTQLQ